LANLPCGPRESFKNPSAEHEKGKKLAEGQRRVFVKQKGKQGKEMNEFISFLGFVGARKNLSANIFWSFPNPVFKEHLFT